MVQPFFTMARFYQTCFYGRMRDNKVQVFFGLKIANIDYTLQLCQPIPGKSKQCNETGID
jgi:hypothetical protein